MLRSPARILIALALAALAVSCINPHRVRMADTDPAGWSAADPVQVAWLNDDTTAVYNIRVVARLLADFNYDPLVLSLTTITPDGYRWKDTLCIPTRGRLPEIGLFGLLEQPYRSGVVLSQPGQYLFELAPIMRNLPPKGIEGVAAVGIAFSE